MTLSSWVLKRTITIYVYENKPLARVRSVDRDGCVVSDAWVGTGAVEGFAELIAEWKSRTKK